jgi:hypothetical protein
LKNLTNKAFGEEPENATNQLNHLRSGKKMKGLCYIAMIIGFFIFYQQNPVYAVLIIVLFVGIYLYFKSKKSFSTGKGRFGFLSGKQPPQDTQMDNLIKLMMIQQIMNSNTNGSSQKIRENENKEKDQYLDKINQEIQEILDDA